MTPELDVQQRADAELGAAWRRCEAALPSGWELDDLSLHRIIFTTERKWRAIAQTWTLPPSPEHWCSGWGDTPAAALAALTEALANR